MLQIWCLLLLSEMFISYKECLSFQEASLQTKDYSQERLYEISIMIMIIIIIIIIINIFIIIVVICFVTNMECFTTE